MRGKLGMSSDMAIRDKEVTQVKRRRGVSPIVFFVSIILVLAVGFVAGVYRYHIVASVATIFNIPASAETLDTDLLQQTYRQLKVNFDGNLDDNALINGATRGMVEAAGDDYTVFLDAEEAARMNDNLEGSIGGGIGAQIGVRDEIITLVKILPDTPAARMGLQPGDKVRQINNQTTEGFSTEQAVEKIRGEVGTTVKLAIERDFQTMDISVTRAEISTPSVESEIRGDLGILTIMRFDQETGSLVRAAAESFKNAQVKGVVVDLRGNPGGYLSAAQEVAGVWLDNKVVVVEKTGDKVVDELRSRRRAVLGDVPTVVLVDSGSASASEIVAGALRDHEAAILVGEVTYGKGTVQRLVELSNGAVLKVTVARWFTPNGLNLSEKGITPDHLVELNQEDMRSNNDPQMTMAEGLLQP